MFWQTFQALCYLAYFICSHTKNIYIVQKNVFEYPPISGCSIRKASEKKNCQVMKQGTSTSLNRKVAARNLKRQHNTLRKWVVYSRTRRLMPLHWDISIGDTLWNGLVSNSTVCLNHNTRIRDVGGIECQFCSIEFTIVKYSYETKIPQRPKDKLMFNKTILLIYMCLKPIDFQRVSPLKSIKCKCSKYNQLENILH